MVNLNEPVKIPAKALVSTTVRLQTAFRRDVQGLRAIAVLVVMLFHASKTWLPSGFIGVDVFFVISGYIICSLIIDGKTEFSWSAFYWGRAKRIVPAYGVMLAAVSIFSALLFLPGDFHFFKGSLQSAILFYSNQYFSDFGSYFAPGTYELPLLHTWSLAIEMQFYLFFPLLILFTPRKYLTCMLGVMCVTLFGYAEWSMRTQVGHSSIYYSLIARVPEFLIGALVAITRIGRNWSMSISNFVGWIGLILLAFLVFCIDEKNFPGVLSILPCIATGLLIAARTGTVSKLLSTDIFVWVGGLSYSLYLWHWPVLAFIRYYTERYELGNAWVLVFLITTFLLAWLSFRCVEIPTRNSTGLLAKPIRVGALLMVLALIVVGSSALNEHIEKPLPIELTRYARPEAICHGRIIGECLRGSRTEAIPVLVLGDSHAAQLNGFFDAVVRQENMAARVITASNCVPISGFDVDRIPEYSRADCRSQIAALAPYIDQATTIVVAAMWEWQASNSEFLHAFSNFLEDTTKRNVRVVVLAQIPMFDFNPRRVRRFSELGLPIKVSKNEGWEKANNKIAEIVRQYKGAEFMDFSHSVFFAEAPFYSGTLIYMDNHHLNERGAYDYGLFAAPFMKPIFTSNH